MLTPGFEIYNDTLWPMQVSLRQAGPLYYELVQPGQYFRRRTGAVWFTIHTSVSLDNKLHITDAHVILPIVAIASGSIATALSAGSVGLAMAFAASLANINAQVAERLKISGREAAKVLVINGTVLGDVSTAESDALLAHIFNDSTSQNSKKGIYAGPPWPLRRNVHTYRITGGPDLRPIESVNKNGEKEMRIELLPRALSIG